MKTNYTKGEWRDEIQSLFQTMITCNGQHLMTVKHELEESHSEKIANAKLIAAAPKMIKQLMLTYLQLQIQSKEFMHVAALSDTIRASLRGVISESLGITEEDVQKWCEEESYNYTYKDAWKAIV